MQQGQQEAMRARPKMVSHIKENEGKQHEEVQVGRGPAGAAAAVLAQDRDIREQVEAEQGKKPKKQKQPRNAGRVAATRGTRRKKGGTDALNGLTNRLLG
jgi:alkyl hydroperoxide reductase subunit AhpF